jgi:hypothetical protein
MRKLFFLLVFLSFCSQVFSQTVVITDDATYTTGNASSVLDVKSVLKGFLAPRMTQAQRIAIATPADGLLVYQTDATKGFYYYNGTTTAWVLLTASAGTNWSLAGNAGTNSSTNYLGTTDAVSLRMRTNATQRVLVDSVGNVAVGSLPTFTAGTPREKFLVDAGSSTTPNTSYNVISGKGYIDNYLQLNIQNRAGTASASSDLVASNDAATESVNYVDLGINSSGNTSTGVLGGASTAYLYSTGNDFAIGNGTTGKNLLFFTGGANERMRIDGSGNMGIGTTSPLYKLHVSAIANPLYLTGVQTGAATDSILTIIGGVVRKIHPSVSGSSTWNLAGNAATNSSTNYLGTSDAVSLRMRTNATQRVIIDSVGNVAVGSAPTFTAGTPREKFLVDAGSSTNPNTSYNVISGKGYIDNYLQLNIQNRAGTASASSDLVASNDAATEAVNFVDLGINSSGYTGTGVIGGASNGYLYSTGNDFAIGNGTAGKNLIFFTGGVAANERVRIDGSGNVGVATTSPAAKLDVSGTYKLGTAGTVLTNMIKASFTFTDNSVFTYASATQVETVTVTGATTHANLIINPRTALPSGISIAWSRVTGANTVDIGFVNADSTPRALGTIVFDVTVIQ